MLDTPRLGCVNIHASLLPRWRRAAPVQRAILAGDTTTGISIMQMDAGLDTGPVLLERAVTIGELETAGSLHDRLAQTGASALLMALEQLSLGTAMARPQLVGGVTYAHKIRKEEAEIDWATPAVQIDRQVRAFNPWPVAQTRWAGQQLRIWEAVALALPAGASPGTVVRSAAQGIDVATAKGVLRLIRVQVVRYNISKHALHERPSPAPLR